MWYARWLTKKQANKIQRLARCGKYVIFAESFRYILWYRDAGERTEIFPGVSLWDKLTK